MQDCPPRWLLSLLTLAGLLVVALLGGAPVVAGDGTQVVAAVALTPAQAPQGDYSIAVPDGWAFNPIPRSGALTITPPGQADPSIYLLPALRVSDARYQVILGRCNQQFAQNPLAAPDLLAGCIVSAVQSQLADSSHSWAPQDALPVILQLASGGSASFGPSQLMPISSTEATFAVPATRNGQPFTAWGYLGMAYLPNPLLAGPSGAPGVSSLAFVGGCEAPADQVDRFRPLCAAVLRSFQPSDQWAANLARQVMQSYQQEFQALLQMGGSIAQNAAPRGDLIAQFGASLQQLQTQTFQQIQAANLRMGQDWIANLGQNTYVRDPNTGKRCLVPAGYDSYCLNAAGDQVLVGSGLVAGRYVDNPGNPCQTLLHP